MLATMQRRASVSTTITRTKPAPLRLAKSRRAVAVAVLATKFDPPTVSQTKAKFMEGYTKPIASIYSTVLLELLVQQHFMRYSKDYVYNEIFALGFVSVYEQILENLQQSERDAIFVAYINALGEEPETYKRDAERIETAAAGLAGPNALTPDAGGNDVQKALGAIQAANAAGAFSYNKFVAIGLFRLLELTGAKEPAALERLVKSVGIKPEPVNRDLLLYKGVLSKLAAAKEMLREFVEREKRKQAERDAAKAAKAESSSEQAQAVPQA